MEAQRSRALMSQKFGAERTLDFISLNLIDTATEAQKEDKARADEMIDNHQQTQEYTICQLLMDLQRWKFEVDAGYTED